MIKKIDHVGIVVADTKEMASLFSELFGFNIVEEVEFPKDGFKSTMISKEHVQLELIEALGSRGIIHRFIQKRGYGIHHISLQVEDMDSELESLRNKGVQLVNEKPLQVTDTSKVSFIHPSSTKGLLIELIDRVEP